MRWAVIFTDNPEIQDQRQHLRPAHLHYLALNADQIVDMGSLRPMPDAPHWGGLWVVRAESFDTVLELIKADPYYDPEVRSFQIFAWDESKKQQLAPAVA